MGALKTREIADGKTKITILETGDIRLIESDAVMINQLPGNYLDGMAGTIFLRIYGNGMKALPLMGKASGAAVRVSLNSVEYSGIADGIPWRVVLSVTERMWFFTVRLEAPEKQRAGLRFDLVYAQDIGLAGWGHVRSNEAYNSQYIDHRVFQTAEGAVICSRQNQRQETGFPFLQQGCFERVVSYSVDGYPFYGLSYKFDNAMAELGAERLNSRIYQYEYAFSALQTDPAELGPGGHETVFYAAFLPNLETAIEKPLPAGEIRARYAAIEKKPANAVLSIPRYAVDTGNVFSSAALDAAEIEAFYPERCREEREDGHLLSFFTRRAAHVVTAEKERRCERPHGNIIITGKNDFTRDDILTATQFMYGVFNSHIAAGNTSFNKIVSNCRNALNVQKISGQRLMVRIDGTYRLLAMPAVFEMGLNYSRWLYKIDDPDGSDILEVTVFTALERPLLSFRARSLRGKRRDFLLYTQLAGGADEYASAPPEVRREENRIFLRHGEGSFSRTKDHYPDLEFVLHADRDFTLSGDERFYPESGSLGEDLLVMEFLHTDQCAYILESRIDGRPQASTAAEDGITMDFEAEADAYCQWMRGGINNFSLSIENNAAGTAAQLEALNFQSLWYSHNARIHFSSPHGLEQYGGAAWGTRDVCQGPFEFFMAAGNFKAAREIILRVYAAQFDDDGSWPQWFMFDRYRAIRAGESHGDVILWPMKALADYLNASGDAALLEEKVSYARRGSAESTPEARSVFEHLEKQFAHIRGKLIPGTALLRYGDGDWDDTLQPFDAGLRDKMASGWTNALLYQILRSLEKALGALKPQLATQTAAQTAAQTATQTATQLAPQTAAAFAEELRRDFYRHVIVDGIAAGFVIFEADGTKRLLLHPRDHETGLSYRLLPMTRGMTAELFELPETAAHLECIRRHLYHPDGVRLMNTACRYRGGINRYFARAETAANFGREIGLQYVHAHIRFAEAMAKTGEAAEAWNALIRASPVLRRVSVKNALLCQANSYFSSSDGCFDNRYDAMKDFDKLRTGDIPVKTGWRVYSSGPGIYLNQLISNILGIRAAAGSVIIDPVLPAELDGLRFDFAAGGNPARFVYHLSGKGRGVERICVNGREIAFERLPNPYRPGGAAIPAGELVPGAEVDIFS
ncbi:MAG: hypothetical protein LBG76_02195 [Treponema sp.]|jgi:cellobiose phosphorylase|nr:hypothetical protein [Treponema sp.]